MTNRKITRGLITGSLLTLPFLLTPATSTAQDGARINQDGTVDFTVYLAFPPTNDDVDRVESMIRASSKVLCDATDGDLRFGKVRLTTASAAEGVADVWVLPGGLWSQSGSGGLITDDDSRVFLSVNGRNTLGLTHELGHAILDLRDAYDNQNYKGTYFGIGYARDPGTCSNYLTPVVCAEDLACGGTPGTCVGSTISGGANTIMNYNMVSPKCSLNPSISCSMGDFDCAGGNGTCEPPLLQSEILPGNAYDYNPVVKNLSCPGALPGKTIELHGQLDKDSTTEMLDLSSLGDAKDTAGHYVMMRYFDEIGAIDGLDQHSMHDLWMFAELQTDAVATNNNVWRLHFVMESKHLMTPPNEGPVELGSVIVDFNGGSSVGPYSGSTADTALVLYECDIDDNCAAPAGPLPIITIPELSNGANTDTLEVDVNLWQLAGADKLGWSRILAADGEPQRGDCSASRLVDPTPVPQDYCTTKCEGMWTDSPNFRWVAAEYTQRAIRLQAGAYSSEWDRVEVLPTQLATGPNRLLEDSFNASITAHGNSVTADSSSLCGTADDTVDVDPAGINAAETIIVLMDRSDSMNIEYDSFGQTASRLKWAKGATEALGVLVQNNNDAMGTPQQIGLVTFSHDTEEVFPVEGLSDMGTDAEAFEDTFEDLNTQTSTALARGLERAGQAAAGKTNPAIIVLTDGEPNICLNGSSENCDPMQDAIDEACQLNADGVQTYYTPLNNDMGGTLFEKIGACGPSANHASTSPRQIPLQFGRSYVNFSGIAPIVDGDAWSVGNTPLTTTIPVEEGATQLTIMLTSRADDLATWDVGVDFNKPSGPYVDGNSPGVTEIIDDDHVYHIITIDDPEAGTWVMRLWSDNANTQDGYTLAWTNTPEPDLHVGVSTPTVTDTNLPVEVRALPSWRTPIDDAECEIDVERPDGSVVGVSLEPGDPEHPAHRGQFDDYNGRGVYRVRARCESTEDSRFMMGDAAHSPNETLETPPAAPEFVRAATTTFFVDMASTALPPGSDCDGDGRSNSTENTALDTDGDGLIDACDPDSDNDDVSDAEETLGDFDGDGLYNVHDVDADNDGEHDSRDWDHLDALSYLLHTVGDFDGDGDQDELWGEPDYNSGRGRIVVAYADDLTPDFWHRDTAGILGTAAVNDNFGAVVVAGDFNDDGYDDIAIGAPLADFGGLTQAGEIHIIYGSSGGLTSIGDQLWNTDSAGMFGIGESDEYFGSRMSVGDFNCDGYADVVVGMPDEVVGSAGEAGVIHAIYGSSGGITSTGNDLYYQGYSGANGTAEASDRFGETLAVGDFDNDTCSDVVIGVPGQDSGATNAVGEAYVMYGDATTGVTSTGDWTFKQGTVSGTAAANDRFGTRLWAFDVNSNGYDDVVVMTPGDCSATEKGFNYVYGGSSGLSTSGNTHTCEKVLP